MHVESKSHFLYFPAGYLNPHRDYLSRLEINRAPTLVAQIRYFIKNNKRVCFLELNNDSVPTTKETSKRREKKARNRLLRRRLINPRDNQIYESNFSHRNFRSFYQQLYRPFLLFLFDYEPFTNSRVRAHTRLLRRSTCECRSRFEAAAIFAGSPEPPASNNLIGYPQTLSPHIPTFPFSSVSFRRRCSAS